MKTNQENTPVQILCSPIKHNQSLDTIPQKDRHAASTASCRARSLPPSTTKLDHDITYATMGAHS